MWLAWLNVALELQLNARARDDDIGANHPIYSNIHCTLAGSAVPLNEGLGH